MNFQPLHPKLRPFLRSDGLHHPLVSWPYPFPAFNQRLNQCYQHKLELLSGDRQPNEWDQYYPRLSTVDRLAKYLAELFSEDVPHDDRFTPDRLKFFGQCWTSPDVIAQTSSFCEMFTNWPFAGGVPAVMTKSELKQWLALPDEMKVYRASRMELVQGCCWYPDRTVASKWATIPYNGFLSSARIKRGFVRALFNRRGEIELILQNGKITELHTEPHITTDGLPQS